MECSSKTQLTYYDLEYPVRTCVCLVWYLAASPNHLVIFSSRSVRLSNTTMCSRTCCKRIVAVRDGSRDVSRELITCQVRLPNFIDPKFILLSLYSYYHYIRIFSYPAILLWVLLFGNTRPSLSQIF